MNEYLKIKNGMSIKAFNEIHSHDFVDKKQAEITEYLNSLDKEFFVVTEISEAIEELVNQFFVEPVKAYPEKSLIEKQGVPSTLEGLRRGLIQKNKVYSFKLLIPFSGDPQVFTIRPSTYRMLERQDISINTKTSNVEIKFDIYSPEVIEFEKEKAEIIKKALGNLENANADVERWNHNAKTFIRNRFIELREHYSKEEEFFNAIKLNVNSETSIIFTSNTIKKIEIPQIRPETGSKSEPTLSIDIYHDILNVLYTSGKNMEKKPSLYKGKSEEDLRDLFVFLLETRYEGTTATGETFNKSGKADIILKYQDGSNLFVAECKFWKGPSEFHKAISQLFDRYLTWRDSKAALIIFVQNNDMSTVSDTITKEARNHPYFKKATGARGETSFSYHFHLADDAGKKVLLEIMAFHYNKK
jgi:hypothetical protein